ncbi:TPA: hypothetical protein MFN16_004778 [Klebsiella pneumoniae]|nr:hypothetical protein [Klebsiella pneumoniae]
MSAPSTKLTLKSTAWETFGCRVSGMEAPDEATCVCGVKWRRKPGVAGCRAINSATLPPSRRWTRPPWGSVSVMPTHWW